MGKGQTNLPAIWEPLVSVIRYRFHITDELWQRWRSARIPCPSLHISLLEGTESKSWLNTASTCARTHVQTHKMFHCYFYLVSVRQNKASINNNCMHATRKDVFSKKACRIIRNLISHTYKKGTCRVFVGYHYMETYSI